MPIKSSISKPRETKPVLASSDCPKSLINCGDCTSLDWSLVGSGDRAGARSLVGSSLKKSSHDCCDGGADKSSLDSWDAGNGKGDWIIFNNR